MSPFISLGYIARSDMSCFFSVCAIKRNFTLFYIAKSAGSNQRSCNLASGLAKKLTLISIHTLYSFPLIFLMVNRVMISYSISEWSFIYLFINISFICLLSRKWTWDAQCFSIANFKCWMDEDHENLLLSNYLQKYSSKFYISLRGIIMICSLVKIIDKVIVTGKQKYF